MLKHKTIYLIILIFTISCDEEEIVDRTKDEQEEICGKKPDFSGTVCCILGHKLVFPERTYAYVVNSNISDVEYSWEVKSGDIFILDGRNNQEVKVLFGENFTEGELQCFVKGSNICSESILLKREY